MTEDNHFLAWAAFVTLLLLAALVAVMISADLF